VPGAPRSTPPNPIGPSLSSATVPTSFPRRAPRPPGSPRSADRHRTDSFLFPHRPALHVDQSCLRGSLSLFSQSPPLPFSLYVARSTRLPHRAFPMSVLSLGTPPLPRRFRTIFQFLFPFLVVRKSFPKPRRPFPKMWSISLESILAPLVSG